MSPDLKSELFAFSRPRPVQRVSLGAAMQGCPSRPRTPPARGRDVGPRPQALEEDLVRVTGGRS